MRENPFDPCRRCNVPTVTLTIPGKPYAKARPRFSRKTGRAYDPKENVKAKASIGTIALPHFPRPITGPVWLNVICVFEVPKSWPKKRRAAALGGPHTSKPDCDNVVKSIKDGLTRIAWADDAQVWRETTIKTWGETASTTVTIMWDDAL
ncbi:MAG: RusA family crossover junction endodeoxyribonuclease [Caulobacteraceae bacterium]|nr:RusA family crossover junction endodeoxyribonuclease [Caulobacteraceae bacterium]